MMLGLEKGQMLSSAYGADDVVRGACARAAQLSRKTMRRTLKTVQGQRLLTRQSHSYRGQRHRKERVRPID